MSWFSSKTATPARQQTIREQELGLLQRQQRDLQWTVPDSTCIKTIVIGHLQLRLEITIPQNFPQTAPVMRLLTPASHPWVDTQGYLSRCPSVIHWNPQSPSLLSLLQFVENKLRETPPVAISQGSYAPPPQSQQAPPQYTAYNPYNTPQMPPQQQQGYQPYAQYQQQPAQTPLPTPSPSNSSPYAQYQQTQVPSQYQQQQPQQPPVYQQEPQQAPQKPPRPQSQPEIPTPPKPKDESGFNLKSPLIMPPQFKQSTPPAVSLVQIPPEPRFDSTTLHTLSDDQLREHDNDLSKIKAFVSQDDTIANMYETLLRLQQEISELKQGVDSSTETPGESEEAKLKAETDENTAKIAHLISKIGVLKKKLSMQWYIEQLRREVDELDELSYQYESKFKVKRNPSEDELITYLQGYEKIRMVFHQKTSILKRLEQLDEGRAK